MNRVEPLVSVCVPTYNRAKKLERAVNALIGASYKNLEIIISDNASSDETQSICNVLSASDIRVKYFRHAENRGPTKNFEFARDQATGKYFLWHGDDDYLDPDYIRTCVDELERDPSLVLASGLAAYHNGENSLTHFGNLIQADSNLPLFRVLKYLWLVRDNSIFYGAYRIDRVRDCRMPNMLAGDWVWMAGVLLTGKAKVIPIVYVHRDFEDTMSTSMVGLVSSIGVPRWHARFPWIVMGMNIANQLIYQSTIYKNKSLIWKQSSYVVIFGIVVIKGLVFNLRLFAANIPFLKKIYRQYFKTNLTQENCK